MKHLRISFLSAFLTVVAAAAPVFSQQEQLPSARTVELKAADGTPLKATYFAAARPGPGVLLLHQVNRTRKDWEPVARRLAAAGIHTLTLDMRGHGESGGTPYERLTGADLGKESSGSWQVWRGWPDDIDLAIRYLGSQPGVDRNLIGLGGAGLLGVDNSIEAARRHPEHIKSLVLISGETLREGLQFLHQASQLPGLFVVSDGDEYPPTAEAMQLLYVTSTNPGKRLVHYSAAQDAPWLWYEPIDVGRVPATGNHGTDLFATHAELPGIIVEWFITTLIRTPGHAPPDGVAASAILNQLQSPGGASVVSQQLLEAREKDPAVQLFPEITVSIVGQDFMRAGDPKAAIEVFKLNLLAYPESADALTNLANAYLKDGQQDLARPLAEKAIALLDAHTVPASSWTDTEPQRDQIRKSAQKTLQQLNQHQQ